MLILDEEILAQKQAEQDLIELGAVSAAARQIEELADAANDGKLTVEKIRAAVSKFSALLNTVDDHADTVKYYTEQCGKSEVNDDNN